MADTKQLRRCRIVVKTRIAKTAEEDLQIKMFCNLMKWMLCFKLIDLLVQGTHVALH